VSASGLIAVDWGTSNFRAYLIDGGGRIEARTASEEGILAIADGAFEAVLDRRCGQWMRDRPAAPVLLSGMIGSRQGWREAPYCACPAGAEEIAAKLVAHPTQSGKTLCFVPGLSYASDGGHDVMRGEETQILGALAEGDRERRLV
jgi:2-dehydro-3-deoxygalactonokinase